MINHNGAHKINTRIAFITARHITIRSLLVLVITISFWFLRTSLSDLRDQYSINELQDISFDTTREALRLKHLSHTTH